MFLTKFCIFNFAPFKNKDIVFIIEFDDIKIKKAFIIDFEHIELPIPFAELENFTIFN